MSTGPLLKAYPASHISGLAMPRRVVARAELGVRQVVERARHGLVRVVHVLRVRRDVEQSGDDLPLLLVIANVRVGGIAVTRSLRRGAARDPASLASAPAVTAA